MYDIYRYIFIGGLILFVLMLALTVFLFFYLKIKDVIGDVTGANKRKALDKKKGTKQSNVPQKNQSKKEEKTAESQLTSRMSVQDRYDMMEGVEETTALNQKPASKPAAPQKAAPPPQRKAAPVSLKKVVINDPDFVIETDITYVHSNEII